MEHGCLNRESYHKSWRYTLSTLGTIGRYEAETKGVVVVVEEDEARGRKKVMWLYTIRGKVLYLIGEWERGAV